MLKRLGLAALLAFAAGPGLAQMVEVDFLNASETPIYSLHVAPTGSLSWGVDQLAGTPIGPGEQVVLSGFAPAIYDVMIVDATGTECMLDAIDMISIEMLQITESDLAACDGFGG